MYELKTKVNDASINNFLNTIDDDKKREFTYKIIDIMKKVTKEEPKMWGTSIIGFGSYHYKYKSGHEGDMCLVGLSPRKQSITLYLSYDITQHQELLTSLGKYKSGKGCLYVNKEEDVDLKILEKVISNAFKNKKNMKWD
ncbi:MAG: DUF1801 domain-containing protein [Ignavibacteriae bacterium]|nr:DUF1801 domain-containing protein [Ignavibacteriota bacterium]